MREVYLMLSISLKYCLMRCFGTQKLDALDAKRMRMCPPRISFSVVASSQVKGGANVCSWP